MKDINRRAFLKKSALLTAGFAIGPAVAIKALAKVREAPEIAPKAFRADSDATLIFKKEVSRISPAIGKRLQSVEVLAQPDSPEHIIRGLVKINSRKGKFFANRFDQKRFLEDFKFRRKYAKYFVRNIRPHLK